MRTQIALAIAALTAALLGGVASAQPAGAAPGAGSGSPVAPPATTPTPAPTAVATPPTAVVTPAGSAAPTASAAPTDAVAPTGAAAPGPGSAAPGPGSAAPASAAPTAPATGVAAPTAGSAAPAAAPAAAGPKWYEELSGSAKDDKYDHGGTFWLPKGVNGVADGSDQMFYAVLGLSAFCFFAIAFVVIYFVIKYRHRPGHRAEPSSAHSDTLEITWTVIPTIICVFLFVGGWRNYIHIVTPPQRAVEIQVTAKRWVWEFTHQNGVKDDILHVPVNTPVRLVMTSTDVIHSFFVPVLRTKQDVVPGRYTFAWFIATKPGVYRMYCAEYCGTDHSQMKTKLVVHEPGGYERYLADASDIDSIPLLTLGTKLFDKKGCAGCHSLDGSIKVGPSYKGDFGSKVTLSTGKVIDMDETYIRNSILNPQSESRPGFPPSMPSFEGQLKEREILGLIEFIKAQK